MAYDDSRMFSSLSEVTEMLLQVRGKTFREIDKTGRSSVLSNKGSLGNIIEESVFGYHINSDKAPDINIGGDFYELKVTPIKHLSRKSQQQFAAKERLVIEIINYLTLPDEDFDNSTFWNKARNMLIIYYVDDRENKKEQSRLDCEITDFFVMRYEPDELATIRSDWQYIHDKVKSGHADELSESDTNFLAACTKGSTAAKSWRDAPAPEDSGTETIRAKQRAFSYKASYMTAVLRRVQNTTSDLQRLQISPETTLQDYVSAKLQQFQYRNIKEITDKLELPISSSYSFNSQLALTMLGATGSNISKVEQFAAANVTQLKTVVLYDNGFPEQHMSFPAIPQEEWDELADPNMKFTDSKLYDFFENNKFYFVVFQAHGKNRKTSNKEEDTLLGGFLWNMPETDIFKYVQPAWEEVHRLMVNKEPLHYYEGENRLPGTSFNHVFHMRPHARDGKDTVLLPNGEKITKQCWWLDKAYIAEIIKTKLS